MNDETNCRDEDAAGSNLADVDETSEQYRIMAQMEANIRVKDNTGFDMAEYKEHVRVLEEERQRELPQEERHILPELKPRLPDIQQAAGGFGGSDSSLPGESSSRPEEPPLPFTRANRRYVQTARGINNRVKVPEIGLGVVVPKNSLSGTAANNGREHVVKCWGCGVYLRVNILSTLVHCPECATTSPVT